MLPIRIDHFDLLPPERQRALRRGYVRRLFVVAALLLTLLAAIACALLLPTRQYLLTAQARGQARLADLKAAVSSAESGAAAKRYAGLEADASAITSLGRPTPASEVLRDALAVPRSGVALTSLNYSPAVGNRQGVLSLGGVAVGRDDLRAYQLALSATAGFASADLPVSAFVKDSDIPFTITVTLATSTTP